MKYLLVLVVFMAGCAQAPKPFILAPAQQTTASNLALIPQLQVQDMRQAKYLIKVTHSDGEIELIHTKQAPANVIEQALNTRLIQKSVDLSGWNYQVSIAKLHVEVAQHSLKYESNSNIILQVNLTNEKTTLTKNFKRQGTSHGPLRADQAVLEREFNIMLGQVLNDITNDAELNRLINQH